MKFPLALACVPLLLLAGCGDAPAQEDLPDLLTAEPGAPLGPDGAALEPVETLAGSWRVAAIDGEPWGNQPALVVTADGGHIWWEPRCAGAVRSYRLGGFALDTGPREDIEPAPPGSPPRPVCTIGLPPRLSEVMGAIDSATTLGRNASGRLHLAGGERSLTLSAQATEPAATEPRPSSEPAPGTAPRNVAELVGEYRVAGIDGRSVDMPHAMTFSITRNTISYASQCVHGSWPYRYDGTSLRILEGPPEVVCDRGRYPEEDAIEAAMPLVTSVRRTQSNGIELSGGGRTITIYSQ